MDINKKDFLEKHIQMIEKYGGYTAIRERHLYAKVFFALGLRLDKGKGETIEHSHKEYLGNRIYSFELYFPKGISLLKIPANSILDIKSNLIADAIHRSNDVAKLWKLKYPDSKVILLFDENTIVSDTVLKKAKALKLTDIYSIKDFIKHINKIKKLNEEVKREDENWKQKRRLLIENAQISFRENNCTLFLGAGVSQDAGGPSWRDLLIKSIKKMRKPFIKEDFKHIYEACAMSPIIMGRYIVNNKKMKDILIKYLHDYILYKNVDINKSELISAICEMVSTKKIESIITYNYDDLVETAIKQKGLDAVSIYSKSRNLRGELPVYHVHGLIPEKDSDIQSIPVFSEDDYHNIYRESYHWSNVEQLHALDRNSCFFIGLSMTDPNLRRLLDVSFRDGDKVIRHFAFLKREKLYQSDNKHEKNEKHFQILENQLDALGVYVIWYEEYKEIPQMLKEICAELNLIV